MPNIYVQLPDPEDDGEPGVPYDDLEGDEDLEDLGDDLDERYHDLVAKLDAMSWVPGPERGLPEAILVAGKRHDLRVFQPYDDTWWQGCLGALFIRDGIIWVRADRPPAERRKTLLHEVLHAVDEAAGTSAGEPVVRAWAPVLLDALRRNPELVSLLLDE